jgi:hypothetical protein
MIPPKGDATYSDYPELKGRYLTNVEPAPKRSFFCPGCDIPWWIRPIQLEHTWHYRGKCPDCGLTWSNLYKIKIKCSSCGTLNMVTHKNPKGACQCGKDGQPDVPDWDDWDDDKTNYRHPHADP